MELPLIADDRDTEQAFSNQLRAELNNVDKWKFNSGQFFKVDFSSIVELTNKTLTNRTQTFNSSTC